jgi:16S rRNA (cytidine1402-2'-O)-methyltransferase
MSQATGGALVVVATPIGNLGDMSPRAGEALAACAMVLAEDTRHSRPLLDRVGFHGAVVSCHAHNESERVPDVIERITRGERVGLVTDAGAPGISDPGGRVIAAVAHAGLRVEVIPGPSAVIAALMGAGIDAARFAFLGFLPRTGKERERHVMDAAHAGLAIVLYEAPQRTGETLEDLARWLGPRRVVVARELTKLHETFHRGVLGAALEPPLVARGEVVIVVEGGELKRAEVDVEGIARDASLAPKERAKRIAAALGIPVRDAYLRVEQAKATGEGGAVERLERALAQLAEAARSLVDAERAAGQGPLPPTPQHVELAGADELMALLAARPALRAPVEVHDAARALLAALSAFDALKDALAFEADSRRAPDAD